MKPLGTSLADAIQDIPLPVVMFSKEYEAGHCIGLHAHPRMQFLYALSGTMKARTRLGSWIVPPGYGLLIPFGVAHAVEMFGKVSLRSAYIQPAMLPEPHLTTCSVIDVSSLLQACIDRFATRPLEYQDTDIAVHLAAIIVDEIVNTPSAPMALPLPISPQILTVTEALLHNPADQRPIDQWAHNLGMSRRSFTRAFRADTGISFDRWRQRLRFQVASELIAAKQPISRVAAKVGYRSAVALREMMARHA